MELVIKKCKKCGAMVKVLEDFASDNCNIKCCGEDMEILVPNSVDAAIEKHIPTYEVVEGKIVIKVNHVMEEDHYIKWISIKFSDKECTTYFKPGMECVAHCKYVSGAKIYAYCNKHDL